MTTPQKILFVDDDANLLAAFQRNLRRQFAFDTAVGGPEGLELLRAGNQYAMFVVDMRMPGMDGIEFLEQARKLAPDAVRLMLTGNADQQTAVDAVNRGQVFRFLNKPCPPEVLIPAIENGLKQYEMQRMERELLEGTLTGSVKVMTDVLGMVMPEALGRGQRLRESMRQFAKFINATPLWEFEVAALLSSIGCASLPARVLEKFSTGANRTVEEEKLTRLVPQIGHDLLASIPRFGQVAKIILFQRKNFDGSEIPPIRCAGEDIPLGARMLRILVDRMTLETEGITKQRALQTMESRSGAYDPKLLRRCFECFPALLSEKAAAGVPVRSLYIKELSPNHVVTSDVHSVQGTTLIRAGNRLTPMVLQKLKNYDTLGEVKQPVMAQEVVRTDGSD